MLFGFSWLTFRVRTLGVSSMRYSCASAGKTPISATTMTIARSITSFLWLLPVAPPGIRLATGCAPVIFASELPLLALHRLLRALRRHLLLALRPSILVAPGILPPGILVAPAVTPAPIAPHRPLAERTEAERIGVAVLVVAAAIG